MTTNVKAVRELAKIKHPGSGVYISGECESDLSGVTLTDGSNLSFTFDDVLAKKTELQAEYDSKQYQRDRLQEYPSIQECVHAILDDDLEALQARRSVVKAKYPKPT